MNADQGHAVLAPSFAPVWGKCSAAIKASADKPNFDTDKTREGTAAHWVGAEVLTAYQSRNEGSLLCSDYIGETAPNGVVIDDKMAEGAQVYVSDIIKVANNYDLLQSMYVEYRVHMPDIHATDNWGTLDCALIRRDMSKRVTTIYLWDYKHGHRENNAFENLQLINYVNGLINELEILGDRDQFVEVFMRVVQPFCYHADGPISEWKCRLSDLRPYFNKLHSMSQEALTEPKMTTGLHCRDCGGVGECSARRKAGYNLIDYVNQPYRIDEMTGRDLAIERQIMIDGMAAMKARLNAIEDDLSHRIKEGEPDTGLTVEAKYGRLSWTVDTKQAIALASQFGFDISKESVVTPTQAKQAAPKEVKSMFNQVLKTVTEKPLTGLKLVNVENSITHKAFTKP